VFPEGFDCPEIVNLLKCRKAKDFLLMQVYIIDIIPPMRVMSEFRVIIQQVSLSMSSVTFIKTCL
jgi:hypothetical protein